MVAATIVLLEITELRTDEVLFEVVSAFATVGLSTGITADLPTAGQLILVALMFLGRLGPITLVSALALRERHRRYQLPGRQAHRWLETAGRNSSGVVVIGLGRFGTSLALELVDAGHRGAGHRRPTARSCRSWPAS